MARKLPQPDLLQHVDPGRRALLKTLLAGTFAAPVIASFSMEGLSVGEAEAGLLFSSGNVTLDCLPAQAYFEDPPNSLLPRHLFKADFHDTNASNVRIQVRARFEVVDPDSEISFTLELSRRQTADAFVIRMARAVPSGVLDSEILATIDDLSGLPGKTEGVISQMPDCGGVGPLVFAMANGWARLEVQLPDGSLLRGAIMPIA
jgi:hypothetical protein